MILSTLSALHDAIAPIQPLPTSPAGMHCNSLPTVNPSRLQLKLLLPTSQTIALRQITIDRYGRTIAEAYRNGQSVGLKLVSEGYAVVYLRYLDGCAETEDEYLAAEEQAQVKRLNYWSQETIVMPWDFRWGRG